MIKKIADLIRKGLLQNIVIGIYFLTLLTECYFLYTRNYFERVYSRPTLMPILFLVFLQQFISRNHLYIIGAMIAACLGDYLTISYSALYQWTGLGCYGLSFIFLAIQFFKLEYFSFKTGKLALFIPAVGLILYVVMMQYFAQSHNLTLTKWPLTFLYATAMTFFGVSIFNILFNNKNFNFRFALLALGFLILANLLFDTSLYYFHRRQTWIDCVSAFSYGTYQFIIVRGLLRAKDKIMGTEYFQQI